jgi:hypothetical protein
MTKYIVITENSNTMTVSKRMLDLVDSYRFMRFNTKIGRREITLVVKTNVPSFNNFQKWLKKHNKAYCDRCNMILLSHHYQYCPFCGRSLNEERVEKPAEIKDFDPMTDEEINAARYNGKIPAIKL